MKTTVCTSADERIVVEPETGGRVRLSLQRRCPAGFVETDSMWATQDAAGVLMFAIEQAAEASRIAQEREAA